MSTLREIASLVKSQRLILGMTQEKVGKFARIRPEDICKVEAGKLRLGELRARRLGDVLDIDWFDLMENREGESHEGLHQDQGRDQITSNTGRA